MENRSLVTIAEHSKEKILYMIEMAKQFEAVGCWKGKWLPPSFSSRLPAQDSVLKQQPTAWEPV